MMVMMVMMMMIDRSETRSIFHGVSGVHAKSDGADSNAKAFELPPSPCG